MRWKVFIGTLSALVTALASPVAAQGAPSSDDLRPESANPSSEQPATPASSPTRPGPAPTDTSPASPPVAPTAQPTDYAAAPVASPPTDAEASQTDTAELRPTKIGAVLSPLIITTGLGYAYASVTHPELASRNLSGAFLEVAVGTELERRFRLSLAFTSFETKLRRTSAGQWEEGEFGRVARLGLGAMRDPVDPASAEGGGAEVQKTLHVHSLGPRMDFLPLGSQGPYLGMTAALAVIQDVSTRVGANLGVRVGAEWRPFNALALAIEGGAHGQIYSDAKATTPYAMARMTLLLEVSRRRSAGSTPMPVIPMQRTLPAPVPR
jgi:hypothetical protein